jgi:glutamate/aspartate transport system substrate-binding protein
MLRAGLASVAFTAIALIGADCAVAQTTGGRLKSIGESKTIRIAHRADAVPFSYFSKDGPAGYTIDVCKLVVASLERQLGVQNMKIEWVPVTTQTRFDVIVKGAADLECGSSTVTLGRMKQVDFSNYVFVESTGLAVRRDAGINGLKDVGGKKIAVIAGTSNEKAVALLNQQLQLNAIVVPAKDRDEAVAALDSKQVDAFAWDKLLLIGAQYKDRENILLLPDDLSIEPYAIALPRGDWELRLAVNTALGEIFRTGEAKRIFYRWFGSISAQPTVLLGSVYLLGALPE